MIRNGLLHVPFGNGRHAPITAIDQARVIVGILENPAAHKGAIYPLFGPVEYTYAETAHMLSDLLGKEIEYKQIDFQEFKKTLQSGVKASANSPSSRTLAAQSERTPEQNVGDEYLFQHLIQVAIDHQNGICAGTNDNVEKIGGRLPTTLEAFVDQHRAAFV
jgi:NAD(P)H dehydrogenase (quinone)